MPDLRAFLPTPSEERRNHACFCLSLSCIQQQGFCSRGRTSALCFSFMAEAPQNWSGGPLPQLPAPFVGPPGGV